jgi:rod shape-determining protein MreC
LKLPLGLFRFIGCETSALVFFHRNYSQRESLLRENDFLRSKIIGLNELQLENSRLKNLLRVKNSAPYKVILAKVIGRSPDNWSAAVIIDKGRFNGVNNGMAAISFLGLIGKVMDSGEGSAKVMLVNDPNFAVSSIIQRSRQEGLVCGTLGNTLVMKYLPPNSDVRISDTVITSGLNSQYPKGIVVGTVTDVGEEFSGLSMYAVIRPAVRLSNIEELLIIAQ